MKKALILALLLMFTSASYAQTRKSAPAKTTHSAHSKRKAKVRQANANRAKKPLPPSRKRILHPPKPPAPPTPRRNSRKRKK